MLILFGMLIHDGVADVALVAESPWTPAINSPVYTYIESPLLGEQDTLQRQIALSKVWTTNNTMFTTATPTIGYSRGSLGASLQLPALFQVSPSNDSFNRSHLTQATMNVKYRLPTNIDSALSLQIGTPLNEEPFSVSGTRYRVLGATKHTFGQQTLNFNGGYQHVSESSNPNDSTGLFGGVGATRPILPERFGLSSELLTQTSNEQMHVQWGLGTYVQTERQTIHLGIQKMLTSFPSETMDWNLTVSIRHTSNGIKDLDSDGIPDRVDKCLNDPEDEDGYHDWDGCPEANLTLPNPEMLSTMELDRGIAVEPFQSGGFGSLKNNSSKLTMDVSEKFNEQILENMDAENIPVMGSLQLIALDDQDMEIPHATWTIDSDAGMPHRGTGIVVPLIVGEHPVIVRASGYRPYKETITITDDSVHIVHLNMVEHSVDTDLNLPDKIYFDTGSANISERSHALLDEVSEILTHHTTIQLVEIEGHTDNQGSETDNQRLSQQRADAVRFYLVERGVEPERLISKGYGSTAPIADNSSQDGRHLNRRVVFTIEKRQQSE